MDIKTKFSNGDRVYKVHSYDAKKHVELNGPWIIGRVSVEITDSKGIEGEEMFDNYKAQKSYKESYMCVETGIGSGTLHDVDSLFSTESEAMEEYNIKLGQYAT